VKSTRHQFIICCVVLLDGKGGIHGIKKESLEFPFVVLKQKHDGGGYSHCRSRHDGDFHLEIVVFAVGSANKTKTQQSTDKSSKQREKTDQENRRPDAGPPTGKLIEFFRFDF
jgi:hypothetical protein